MPKPTKGPRLGAGPTHQRHIIRGLAASLILEERIRTSEAKARVLRQYADKLVTLGKTDTLHARRQALEVVEDSDVVHKLFADIAPRYTERNGGYTRILKLGPRKGDAAPMAIIEFVEGEAERAEDDAGKRRGRRRRKKDEPEEKPAESKTGRTRAKREEPAEPEAEPGEEAAGESGGEPQASSRPEPEAGE